MRDRDTVLLPLTAAQSGLWFAQQLDPDNPIFQLVALTEIHGRLDPDLLARAVREMILEADALRARFCETDHGPAQVIGAEPQWSLSFCDLSASSDPAGSAAAWMESDRARPFDDTADCLGAYRLFKLGAGHYLWYRRTHHLLTDGYSSVLTARRVAEIYTALARGEASAGSFRPLRSLVDDDRAYHGSDAYRADREFWLAYLANRAEPVTVVGSAGAMPRTPRRHSAILGTDAVTSLDRAASQVGVTWPRLVIAVIAAYLHRVTGSREVMLGLPVAARVTSLARSVPGTLSNVVPLRCEISPGMSISDCAEFVSRELDTVLPHQRFRLERLRRELGQRPGDRLFGPWANVMPFFADLDFAGSRGLSHPVSKGPFQEMSIAALRQRGGRTLRIDIDADPSLYQAEEVAAHHARFASMLTAACGRPDTPIGVLDLVADVHRPLRVDWDRVNDLSDEEVDQLLEQILREEEEGDANRDVA